MILLSLWVQWPIRGIQMSHRWNSCFIQCERSLNEFCSLLSADFSNQKQQSRAYRCAYDVSKIFISQCKQLQWLMGVFESAWILAWLKSMIMLIMCYFALFLYNKQDRIYLLSWHRQNDILGPPSLLIGLYNSTTTAKKKKKKSLSVETVTVFSIAISACVQSIKIERRKTVPLISSLRECIISVIILTSTWSHKHISRHCYDDLFQDICHVSILKSLVCWISCAPHKPSIAISKTSF